MTRRRFFEHSSILPVGRGGAQLSSATPRAPSSRVTSALIRRLTIAIASAPAEEVGALRRLREHLEDAAALHGQAALFEAYADATATMQLVLDTFMGPLQQAVMRGEEVSVTALDAEITRMLAAKARLYDPPRLEHRIAFRKTAGAESRAAALVEAKLAKLRRG